MNQHHQTSQDMSEHGHSNNYQQQHSFQDEGGMANMDLGTIHLLRNHFLKGIKDVHKCIQMSKICPEISRNLQKCQKCPRMSENL